MKGESDSENVKATAATAMKFLCGICSEVYENIQELERHVRQHLKEKPFSCMECRLNFKIFDDYLSHGRKEHNSSDYKYHCRQCEYQTDNSIKFEEHEARHFKAKPFDCAECGQTFKRSSQLNGHKRFYCGNRLYDCTQCEKKFTRSEDLNLHMRLHEGSSIYECEFCIKYFVSPLNFGLHVKKEHGSEIGQQKIALIECGIEQADYSFIEHLSTSEADDEFHFIEEDGYEASDETKRILKKYDLTKSFQCLFCPLRFVRGITLQIHCRRNHTNAQLNAMQKELNKRKLICSICNVELNNRNDLKMHTIKLHCGNKPYKCCFCELSFARPITLFEHTRTHVSKKLQCSYCSKVFTVQHCLDVHVKMHEGNTTIPCPICNIPYSNEVSLQRHQRIHTKGKPHKCDYCDRSFATTGDKQKHTRSHTGEKPFKCEICEKSFSHLTSYKKHRLIHSGVRNFQCPVCGKAFNTKSNLAVHSRSHTGERPFACETCGKTFLTSGHLGDHVRIHTRDKNFKCSVCSKNFLNKGSYDKHMKGHAGDKPYECNICLYRFFQNCHLIAHYRTHTNEKPFVCDICNKAFKRKDALAGHRKIHTNREKTETGAAVKSVKETEEHNKTANDSSVTVSDIVINLNE